mmetsp:Transcript_41139/g.65149  ORF Transcript_41139/g.65149 Transcript_41139/m.65149 type:complete len:654 (-) Transcript_41139:167-2128(-)
MVSGRDRGGGGKRRKFGASALGNDVDSDEEGGTLHPHGFAKWPVLRKRIFGILSSAKTDWFLATMILSSVIFLITDADIEAKRLDGLTPEEQTLGNVNSVIFTVYTCVYAIEMTARVYVFRMDVFRTGMLFDFLIVVADVGLLILDMTIGNSPKIGFLRMFRLARLFRFVRVVGMFPELQFLVKGFISSFSAVFWGSILMWAVILMWAIIAVYWIHPTHKMIVSEKVDDSCEPGGPDAWRGVWYSVITLTQTVVFGDSWGATAIEIIRREPITLFFFAGMYGTITLGVLNLIVAAIVDSGAQAREEALEAKRRKQRAEEMKQKERQKNRLLEICQVLDDDESGSLSFEELLTGFDKNTEFRNAMKDYNINRQELDVLFRVFDETGEGVLDYQEFFNLIDSAREQASQQVLTFVRFAVMEMRKEMEAQHLTLRSELEVIKEMVLSSEQSVHERMCRFFGEAPPPRRQSPGAAKRVPSSGSSVGEMTPLVSPRQGPAKAAAKPAAKQAASPQTKPPAPPAPVQRPGNGSRHPTSDLLPPAPVAPLQQLLKTNRELLKGMKKLLDASNLETDAAQTAGRSMSPRVSEGQLDPQISSRMNSLSPDTLAELQNAARQAIPDRGETRIRISEPEARHKEAAMGSSSAKGSEDEARRTSI